MKLISFFVLQIIAVIAANVTFIWAIVEFILYIAKDKVFNCWSVWGFIISAILTIIFSILIIITKPNKLEIPNNKPMAKSRFQQKLEEMQSKKI